MGSNKRKSFSKSLLVNVLALSLLPSTSASSPSYLVTLQNPSYFARTSLTHNSSVALTEHQFFPITTQYRRSLVHEEDSNTIPPRSPPHPQPGREFVCRPMTICEVCSSPSSGLSKGKKRSLEDQLTEMDEVEGCEPFGNRRLLQCIYLTPPPGKSKGKPKTPKPINPSVPEDGSTSDPNQGIEENDSFEEETEDITIIDTSSPHRLSGSNNPLSVPDGPFVPVHAFGSKLRPASDREEWERPEDVEGWDVIEKLEKEKEEWDKQNGEITRIMVRNVKTGEIKRAVIKDESFEIWESCARAIEKERQDFWEFVLCNLFFLTVSFVVLFLRQRKVATRQYLELAARIGVPRSVINASASGTTNGSRESTIEEGLPLVDMGKSPKERD